MRHLQIRIEHLFDVAVQCPHDADPGQICKNINQGVWIEC
jgi:hypothetical protein